VITLLKKYLCSVKERKNAMLFKRYIFYILFSFGYILALILEKPAFSVQGSWLSYLPTFFVHFSLLMFIVLGSNAVLIPFFLEKKRIILYVACTIVLMSLFSFFTCFYNNYIHKVLFHDGQEAPGTNFLSNFMIAVCFIIIASMLYVTQKWSEQREQVKNIQINQLQTELKYLRSQINPHFLFNGLNTIYGYIDKNNYQARNILIKFSDLLRYNLYESDVDRIELAKEIKYLQDYVALQRARSNDNLEVTLKVNCKNGDIKIAPLIFMAFVENAFKYVSRADNVTNTIIIELNEESGRIDFICINSYDEMESIKGGIGLNNAVRRLDLLYKDHYHLDIKSELHFFHVYLTLT